MTCFGLGGKVEDYNRRGESAILIIILLLVLKLFFSVSDMKERESLTQESTSKSLVVFCYSY